MSDSDNQNSVIVGIVVSLIAVLIIVLLVVFHAKVIQCLETVRHKTNQNQEETASKGESESRPPTVSTEVETNANGHAEPELMYVHIVDEGQEQSNEGLYTDLDISRREPESIYQSLENKKGDQENKIYENIDDYETMT